MSLKITGGLLKGRQLRFKHSENTRPTESIVRQAIFNICGQDLSGINFLDLFAGSGIMGFEALSRRADHCTFVEKDQSKAQQLKENAHLLGVYATATIIQADAVSYIAQATSQYQIVFIDASYDNYDEQGEFIHRLIDQLVSNVSKEGYIFIEERFSKIRLNQPYVFEALEHLSSRKYGNCLLHHYRKI